MEPKDDRAGSAADLVRANRREARRFPVRAQRGADPPRRVRGAARSSAWPWPWPSGSRAPDHVAEFPSAMIRPSSIRMIRSATSAIRVSCVTIRMGQPCSRARLQEQLDDLAAGLAVERRGRLVGEHQARAARQGAGDRDPLLLPAGELGRIGLAPGAEPDELQHPPRRRPTSRPGSTRGCSCRAIWTFCRAVRNSRRLCIWKMKPMCRRTSTRPSGSQACSS